MRYQTAARRHLVLGTSGAEILVTWGKKSQIQKSKSKKKLFTLYCLFDMLVWSVYFLFCVRVRLTKHPIFYRIVALSYSMIFHPMF